MIVKHIRVEIISPNDIVCLMDMNVLQMTFEKNSDKLHDPTSF